MICSSDQLIFFLSYKMKPHTDNSVTTSFPILQTEKERERRKNYIYIHRYSSTLSYISQMCKIKQMYTVVQKKKNMTTKKRVYLNKTFKFNWSTGCWFRQRGTGLRGGCTVPSAWSGLAGISTAGGAEVMWLPTL